MNIEKKLILVFLFFLYPQLSFADCGHCFTIVKVKITYTNGENEISNLKFFREYVLANNEIDPKENEAIKKYFPKHQDTLQLIDSIYQIKDLPPFINKEDIRNIALKEVSNIYLLKYTTIQGAFELPHLSSVAIEKIINSDTLYTNTKIFSVHDEIYVYTGNKLSLANFNLLTKESYHFSDDEPSLTTDLKIDARKNIYPSKIELNKDFDSYIKEINKKICATSDIKINPEIDAYFRICNTNLNTRIRYLELVMEYLNTSETTNLENFICTNVAGDFQKNSLLKEIDIDRTIIKNTIALARKMHVFEQDYILSEEFYKVLEKENIIVLAVSWD